MAISPRRVYVHCMSAIFFMFAIAACVLVIAVLIFGVGSFARGGEFNRKYSNKIMRLRILAQAIAVVLILIAIAIARAGR